MNDIRAVHLHTCPTCLQALPPSSRITFVDDERAIICGGKSTVLSPSRYRLLRFMWDHRNLVMSKERLHHGLYGERIDGGPELKIIDVYVFQLRMDIHGMPLVIDTLRSEGYRLRATQ